MYLTTFPANNTKIHTCNIDRISTETRERKKENDIPAIWRVGSVQRPNNQNSHPPPLHTKNLHKPSVINFCIGPPPLRRGTTQGLRCSARSPSHTHKWRCNDATGQHRPKCGASRTSAAHDAW